MSELTDCIPSCEVEINGFTWRIYATTTKETIDRIELVSKALRNRGYHAPRRASFGGGKPQSKPLTQPLFDTDGTPCCPHHTRRDGRPLPLTWKAIPRGDSPGFWGCNGREQHVAGEQLNANGYCKLIFDWPASEAPANGKVTR